MIVVPAEAWHFDLIDAKEHERDIIASFEDKQPLIKHYLLNSIAFSGLQDGKIIVIAGVMPLYKGSAEAWMFCSKDIKDVPLSAARHIKTYFNLIVENMALHRVQITVKYNYEEAFSFAKFLGFEQEGIMRKYGIDKSDYVLMSKVLE